MNNERKQITLDVAGFCIQINLFPSEWLYSKNKLTRELLTYYRNFITNEKQIKCDFIIDVVEQRNFIFYKRKDLGLIELFKEKRQNYLITYYQLSIIQFQLLVNNALHYLLEKHNGCVLHGAANNIKGGAVIFLGPSGQGKSTIMKLLHSAYPALADDSIILRKINNKYFVFQTPTREKESWVEKTSRCYPLKSIFFLGEKSVSFQAIKLTDQDLILNTLTKQLILNQPYSKKTIIFTCMSLFHF